MHVAVVEDDPTIAELLRLVLNHEAVEHTTLCVRDFARTVFAIDWASVDVVLCDRYLEDGFEGTELLVWLEEQHPHVRRILMTASPDIDAATAHAHEVLAKPASVAAIRAALTRQPYDYR